MISGTLKSDALRYSLFAAIKQLELNTSESSGVGESVRLKDDLVRIRQTPHAIFAATDVKSINDEGENRVGLDQYSFGLLGPNGPLPLHLTQRIMQRQLVGKDPSMAAFLDLFHHRMASLFYRAWADTDPVTSAGKTGNDSYSIYLSALAGMALPTARNSGPVPDSAKWRAAADLGAGTRSSERLQALLSSYFSLPIRVIPFVGSWVNVPVHERSLLGTRGVASELGRGATLGKQSWQRHHQFEIEIGPLNTGDFLKLLPGSKALRELEDWVRLYTRNEWNWRVRLILKYPRRRSIRLGTSARLGWDSWLGRRRGMGCEVMIQGESLMKLRAASGD